MKNLLKKAQRGDEDAFLKIFSMHENELYRIAFLYVKNEQDALDVMQEVAYRTFKSVGSLKNQEYLKTWLVRITINCAIDYLRKNSNIVSLQPEHIENSEEYSEGYENDVLIKITLETLMNVLEPNEKSVIILKYYNQYSFKEISKILNLPLGTVKTILYRALKKLRTEAKGELL